MAYHKRGLSKDITSNEIHATPLPTYYSQQLPRWTSKSAFEEQRVFEVKAEPLNNVYPQFVAAMPSFDDIPLPPRPQRRRLPRKAVLIPWILAAVLFLIALWSSSIALGVRLFMVLQPTPTNPPVQELHVLINEDVLRGFASTYTSFVTLSAPATKITATASAPASTSDGYNIPTTTGRLVAAPIPNADPLEIASGSMFTNTLVTRSVQISPTGFKTVTRMVQPTAPPARGTSEAL
ncbi:hypothetical protein ST47_g7452 [Ascochyta rabiei]|uniref:Uncharacterized protein n=1 Tax=Didymella rabiei TaxID=5454 RepID=A0A163AUG0_DIDRA|nr:hypothetical protein ST47_g7452 [Ascochyta rabiei]